MNNIIIYFLTLVTICVLDSVWLFSMGSHYSKWLGHLFAPKISILPIVIFYLLYAFGIWFFVIKNNLLTGQSISNVFLSGALFGFMCYIAYDLTNQATLRDWPLIVTIVDVAWGTLLTGLGSAIVFFILKFL